MLKSGKAKDIFYRAGFGVTVFGVTFFAALLSSSHFMPISESSAETTGDYYANISTSGAVNFDIISTPDGTAKIGKDTLSVETNATAGYKLYISTISGATGNGLYLENDDTKYATASTGTLSDPTKLAANTWGYAPSRANNTQTSAQYTDADVDSTTGSAIIAGVPEYGDEDIFYTNNAPSTSGTNNIDVYYGVNFSTALPSGTYSNTVVYTAIVDAVNPNSEDITISPASQSGLAAGTEITISTGLYPGFAANNLGDVSVTIGGNDCTNLTYSIAEAGNLVITCNSPAAESMGSVDVVVSVEKYNKTYTITDGYAYAQPAFFTIANMQDMTPAVCASVPKPSADATSLMTTENYDSSLLVENGSYVAQTTLSDVRDGTSYIVRKLADGNCWMTQGLKLGGDKNLTLTAVDSDVSSDFTLLAENTGTWCADDNAICDDQNLMFKTGAPNGYFYNWHTATAGSGIYETSSGNANYSICSKGWNLPTKDHYVALDRAYGGNGSNRTDANQINKFIAIPLSFNYTGYRAGNVIGNNPASASIAEGTYWSSTANSKALAYHLTFYSSINSFNPQHTAHKWYGFAIRCLALS